MLPLINYSSKLSIIFNEQLHDISQYKIFNFSLADEVSVGDEVLVNENNGLIPEKVRNISSFIMKGRNNFK